MAVYESDLEDAVLEALQGVGYLHQYGPDIVPGDGVGDRNSYAEALLPQRLEQAVGVLNPDLPLHGVTEVVRKVRYPAVPGLIELNRLQHRYLLEGVPVEVRQSDGRVATVNARLVDWDTPTRNDWRVINQFTMAEPGQRERRPDLLVFLNGLPVSLWELKNPADEGATWEDAWRQLQTYRTEYPALFVHNEICVATDGLVARFGGLASPPEWFLPWRDLDSAPAPAAPEYVTLLAGLFEPHHLLRYLRRFVVFERDEDVLTKKLAGYHQVHAVDVAVAATVSASRPDGDRRVGVVWHTQGSGKSLTMALYAGAVVQEPAMANPTLVVITDRNDLDDQLFGVFSRCQDLLRQTPVQAASRDNLRAHLRVAAGGVVFTTLQKFLPESGEDAHPLLSDRSNIVVIADEAHRSQYDFRDGLAHHLRQALPHAAFIGFTGTPIDLADRSTRAVFGDYISVYDIQQAVDDHATVPIYYEARLAKLDLSELARPHLDEDFDDVTEGEEDAVRERLKTKWAALESLVGTEQRIGEVARDIVTHFEQRQDVLPGKGMIVAMSRRIAVALYHAIAALRPEWVTDDDQTGRLKVVMTGSASDPLDWQRHLRNKSQRRVIERRFKNPDDPLHLVIVRDMWLTGFDVPPLHTLYVDKPMKGHTLMQAIARVNRVFRDKPGGLVVDYLGLAQELKKALATYTQSGGRGHAAVDQEQALVVLQEKLEALRTLMRGFDTGPYFEGSARERIAVLPAAQDYVLQQPEGKTRFLALTNALGKAFALAVPLDEALTVREEVIFYQAVRAALVKLSDAGRPKSASAINEALQQLVAKAVVSEGVEDVFALAGLPSPDIAILSEGVLEEVRRLPYRNLAAEMLEKLLRDDLKVRSRHNLVQARSFQDLLEASLTQYHNRAIDAARLIEILIALAHQIKAADARGEAMGLSPEEVAFYDALAANQSAVEVLGDTALRAMAQELVGVVQRNSTVDWTLRESAKAKLRVLVKRVLRKHGYPPDQQQVAAETVVTQAELLAAGNEDG